MLAMTMTSKVHPYKTGMGPFAPEVYRAPFPNAYRGVRPTEALAALERCVLDVAPPQSRGDRLRAAVQGEGGFVPAPPRVRPRAA